MKYNNGNQTSALSKDTLVTGYSTMIEDRLNAGWSCDLVTILFDRINGTKEALAIQMTDQVGRFYSTFITRVNRNPQKASIDELPLLIGALDMPVYKKDRTSTPTVNINEGMHFHGILMVPENSRLKGPVATHFKTNRHLYAFEAIGRIDVRPVTHDPAHVMDYLLKTIKNQNLSYDDSIVVLPRTKSEL